MRAAGIGSLLSIMDANSPRSESWFRAAGLSRLDFQDPNQKVGLDSLANLFELVARELPDPDLGLHVGAQFELSQLGPLGYVAFHTRDLGAALRNLARFSRFHSSFEVEVEIEGGRVNLSASWPGQEFRPQRQHTEATIAGALRLLQALVSPNLRPVSLDWEHPAPQDLSAHQDLFGCPMHFSCERTRFWIDASHLVEPTAGADEQFLPVVTRYLESLVDGGNQDPLMRRLRQYLSTRLCDGPTLQSAARHLAIGERSLQRELSRRDTRFRDLLEDCRKEMSLHYVGDGELSVSEIAFLVGYAEPSAFHRAFRRWTGSPPSTYRKRQGGAR